MNLLLIYNHYPTRTLVKFLPVSSNVSANVAEVAFTSGIDMVGSVKNAAIGVDPLGKISNCSPSLVSNWVSPEAANAIPRAPPTKSIY